eukprot:14740458-Ditylum_brightwellii.AAC.1
MDGTFKNSCSEHIQPVWAPWHNNLDYKAIPFRGEGSMITAADNLTFNKARELVHNGFFNKRIHRAKKTPDRRRSISIRVLYNGLTTDRESSRKTLQEELCQYDKTAPVWLSRIQTCANPSSFGHIFYSATVFDLDLFLQNVSKVIQEKTKQDIEITLATEAFFGNEMEKREWYNSHNMNSTEGKEQLNLRKVARLYYTSK